VPSETASVDFKAGWMAAKRDEAAGDSEDIADAPDVAFVDYLKGRAVPSDPPRIKVQRDVVWTAIRIALKKQGATLEETLVQALTQEVVDAYAGLPDPPQEKP
jgi:hypothetical protein